MKLTTLHEAAQQALEAIRIFREWEMGQDYHSSRDTVLARAFAAEETLEAALAEPVQEPVAWQWLDTAHLRKRLPKNAEPGAWNPLYTSPPQRKPLTDEEIDASWKKHWWGFVSFEEARVIARAIERAHGIGGSDD